MVRKNNVKKEPKNLWVSNKNEPDTFVFDISDSCKRYAEVQPGSDPKKVATYPFKNVSAEELQSIVNAGSFNPWFNTKYAQQ